MVLLSLTFYPNGITPSFVVFPFSTLSLLCLHYSKFCGLPVFGIKSTLFALLQILWFPIFDIEFTLFALTKR